MLMENSKSNKRFKSDCCPIQNNNNDPNLIAKICYDSYQKLGKSGKPNASKNEFTVLAGLVEYDKNGIKLPKVICLSTGTKCFPKNIPYRFEDIVDCHAESLLKRAFKCYLVEMINDLLDDQTNNLLSLDDFQLNKSYCLFISQAPCGSFSRWKGNTDHSNVAVENPLKTFKTIGINRKPGRGELCPKAGCIHKIAKWRIFGLQGRQLLRLTKLPITFDRIVIGNCEPEHYDQLDFKGIANHITVDSKECSSIDQNNEPFQFQQSTEIEFAEKFRIKDFCRNDIPCGSSIVAWISNKTENMKCEVLANGRKLGASKRKISLNSNYHDHGSSKISDLNLKKDIEMLINKFNQRFPTVNDTDVKLNSIKETYQICWMNAIKSLSIFNGWPLIEEKSNNN